jgi:hypothetical protein
MRRYARVLADPMVSRRITAGWSHGEYGWARMRLARS